MPMPFAKQLTQLTLLSLIPLTGVFGIHWDADSYTMEVDQKFQPIIGISIIFLLINIRKIRARIDWLICFMCFQSLSLFSFLQSDWKQFAITETFKNAAMFLVAYGFYHFLDSCKQYIDSSIRLLGLVFVCLCGWLSYTNIFVHGRSYLSIDWVYGTDVGR